ncbi:MAG: O-antigen ligase family protein [Candidatus Moraniibacteriota bacterium]
MMQFPIKGAFNEYASAYIYLSDLFFLLTMLVGLFLIIRNKKQDMSSSKGNFLTLIHRLFCDKAVDNSNTPGVSLRKITLIKAINPYFRAIFLGLIFIMLFDHYLWDIWQGQVLFWVVCGFLVGIEFLKCSTPKNSKLFHVEHSGITWQTWDNLGYNGVAKCSMPAYRSLGAGRWNIFRKSIFIIPLILVICSFVSVNWSENQLISLYRSFRLLELYLLFIYISLRFVPYCVGCFAKCSTLLRQDSGGQARNNYAAGDSENAPRLPAEVLAQVGGAFGIIMFTGAIQSVVGVVQVIIQHSVGLFWLRESIVAPNIAGVAKIIINHQAYIRAYGLFPHPNILGGFLFFSIIITLLCQKMFHVEHFKEQDSMNCSTWNISGGDFWKIVPRGTIWNYLIWLALIIQITGIIFSFSKSAILALIVAVIYIIVPRGTFQVVNLKKLFHVEQFRMLLIAGLVILGGLFFFRVEVYDLFAKSFQERKLYMFISEQIIADSPIVGVGTGQFIVNAEKLFPNLEVWQYQPVHNVFLLIWSEWGIVGLVLFILFLWKLLHFKKY